ncbi:MAG: N-formylglutamate amidohydrolase [Gammaproteobacteria bacterium]|nr:N-formylglutamate amidohydrolase [Gammaproteobacteria bacterium]
MTDGPVLLLSCEHASNRIPDEYRHLFHGCGSLIASHRGYDPGALACARAIGRRLRAPLIAASCSRLLVDLNRSPGHPALFSALTRTLPRKEKDRVLTRYYHPHRARVERWVEARITAGHRVVHVAVHSFTPVLDGVTRKADIGLLYDPARRVEAALCQRWRAALQESGSGSLTVRRNYPYRGASDGLTRYLRTRFPASRYAGIELEINHGRLRGNADQEQLAATLAATLRQSLRK